MKIKFLIAEEIRQEAGGKLTILGLFPDDTIVMVKGERPEGVPPEIPAGFERLALLISVSDLPKGLHKFKGKIVDPSGEVCSSEIPLGEVSLEKGTSRSIIIEMKPFAVKTLGVYRFDFYVDDKIKPFEFEVREPAK